MSLNIVIIIAALSAIVATVVGVLLTRLASRRSVHDIQLELMSARSRAHHAEKALATAHTENQKSSEALSTIRAENATLIETGKWLKTEIDRHKTAFAETKMLLEHADQKFKDTFKAVAAEALNTNTTAFLDLAKVSFEGSKRDAQSALDSLVKPIGETLQKVGRRLEENEHKRVEAYSRLTEQITTLGATTTQLSKSLHTPAVRGRWGEMQLRRVVELAGMLDHVDFQEQPSLTGEAGRQIPDLIVHLAGGAQIVVDAKAPMDAYFDAQEAPTEEARISKLKLHARHVRKHMDDLGNKAYQEQLDQATDTVVMFLPGEFMFTEALKHDSTLIEHGHASGVVLATPWTLMAILHGFAYTLRQEALAQNYREVAKLGKELHDRLLRFVGHFDEVRQKLDGAVQAYNKAAGSFESRVLVSARRLKELKVTPSDDLATTDPIDTTPRAMRQSNLVGLPKSAATAAFESDTTEARDKKDDGEQSDKAKSDSTSHRG